MKLIRIIKDKAERILLLILLGVLILYIAKEVYIDQIQLRLLQLKYQSSLSALTDDETALINKSADENIKSVKRKKFRPNGTKYYLDDSEFIVLGAEIRYYGIRSSDWSHDLEVAKKCGINTIALSIPWNLHEPINGKFNFEKNLNVRKFIQNVHYAGFKAILRIGPWIGHELSFGGLPYWLVKSKINVRTSHDEFLEFVEQWWWRLLQEIEGLDWLNGGPIIAFQIESNYGMFPDKDPTYLDDLVNIIERQDNYLFLFNEDDVDYVSRNNLAFPALNVHEAMRQNIQIFKGSSENQLVFISSLYFSNPWQWNNRIPFHLKQVEIMKELEFIKQENISFILSNFALGSRTDLAMGSELINKRSGTIKEFGSGTRHGLMTEAGAYTNELNQFCLIFNNQSELPEIPSLSIPEKITFTGSTSIFNFIGDLKWSEHEDTQIFDKFGFFYYQIILSDYIDGELVVDPELLLPRIPGEETNLQENGDIILTVPAGTISHRASIYLNRRFLMTIEAGELQKETKINLGKKPGKLQIILDAPGYPAAPSDSLSNKFRGIKDGITAEVDKNVKKLSDWKFKILDFSKLKVKLASIVDWYPAVPVTGQDVILGPVLLQGFFKIEKGGTWMKLDSLRRGVIIINGHMIGRYYEKPERSIFIPEFVLRKTNEIIIYEEIAANPTLAFSSYSIPRNKY